MKSILMTKEILRRLVQGSLNVFGFEAVRVLELISSRQNVLIKDALVRWTNPAVPNEISKYILSRLISSGVSSQLQQDLLACYINELSTANTKFFVEFGATDGVLYSNTLSLEKVFGYTGILAEPARSCQISLRENRSSLIDARCVWKTSNELIWFSESSEIEYSNIKGTDALDGLNHVRENTREYQVQSVSLNDLLTEHEAPHSISYLSIDTEGTEFEILKALDFHRWTFNFISVEHNHTNKKNDISQWLALNGYTQILSEISDFDGWYVHNSLMPEYKKII
jgi:FkbM family methyltransferase